LPDLLVIRPEPAAREPGLPGEELIERGLEDEKRLLDRPPHGLLDLAATAVERHVQVGQRLGHPLARRPGRLGFLGADRTERVDRIAQARQERLRLLLEAPRAASLELQLLPQRRELLDEMVQPDGLP